jgi:glycosyltransferase involved in cell wall biosynthesis
MNDISSTVAVITRTKNRPLLLCRALDSISAQSYKDIIWVLVNDGGEPEPVEDIASNALSRGVKTIVIHHSASKGMEAASNAGIGGSASEFVVIHDDDDSWEPKFLETCITFLDTNRHYHGVVTQSWRIDEKLSENKVELVSKTRFNPGLANLYLIELAVTNSFPPISFVYRRSVFEKVDLYDETLPVLGDWDFNLRVLTKFDVGIIPEPLANYHHRIAQTNANDGYGNSIHAGRSKHQEYDTIIRNRLLRQDIADGKAGLGLIVGLGRSEQTSPINLVIFRLGNIVRKTGLTRLFWKW